MAQSLKRVHLTTVRRATAPQTVVKNCWLPKSTEQTARVKVLTSMTASKNSRSVDKSVRLKPLLAQQQGLIQARVVQATSAPEANERAALITMATEALEEQVRTEEEQDQMKECLSSRLIRVRVKIKTPSNSPCQTLKTRKLSLQFKESDKGDLQLQLKWLLAILETKQ